MPQRGPYSDNKRKDGETPTKICFKRSGRIPSGVCSSCGRGFPAVAEDCKPIFKPLYWRLDRRKMPTILTIEGYRFFFYSSDRPEPPHIHIEHGGHTAKVWLDPARLQDSHGFTRTEINKILRIIGDKQELLLRRWNEYFRHEK